MGSLKSKLLYQFFLSSLYSLIPLIIFPYVSRTLGPEGIGKVNFIDYTAQFILLFTSFGIPLYGIREVSKLRDKKMQLMSLVSELIIIHLILSLIGLIVFLSVVGINKSIYDERTIILLASLNVVISTFSFDWFVQGFEDFEFLSKRTLIVKLLTILFVFVLVQQQEDYNIYYFILISANALMVLLNVVYILRKTKISTRNLQITRHIKPLTFFFLTTAAVSLYTYFDTIILGITVGSLAVGFYTTGLKIIRLTQNFVDNIGNVLLPRVSMLNEARQYPEINRLVNKSLQYVLFTSIPICTFFYLTAPEIIKIVAGNQFLASISVLRFLALLPLLIGLSNIFGMQILVPFKQERKTAIAVLMGSLLNISLNILLCPIWKEDGAAIACITTEFIVTLILYLFVRKEVELKVNLSELIYIIFCSLLFIPIVFACRIYVKQPIMNFLTTAVLCSGLFLFFQYFLFKNTIILELVHFVRNKKLIRT